MRKFKVEFVEFFNTGIVKVGVATLGRFEVLHDHIAVEKRAILDHTCADGSERILYSIPSDKISIEFDNLVPEDQLPSPIEIALSNARNEIREILGMIKDREGNITKILDRLELIYAILEPFDLSTKERDQ